MGHVQLIEYKGLHSICFNCGEYDHRDATCPMKVHNKAPGVQRPAATFFVPVPPPAQVQTEGAEVESQFGHRC